MDPLYLPKRQNITDDQTKKNITNIDKEIAVLLREKSRLLKVQECTKSLKNAGIPFLLLTSENLTKPKLDLIYSLCGTNSGFPGALTSDEIAIIIKILSKDREDLETITILINIIARNKKSHDRTSRMMMDENNQMRSFLEVSSDDDE